MSQIYCFIFFLFSNFLNLAFANITQPGVNSPFVGDYIKLCINTQFVHYFVFLAAGGPVFMVILQCNSVAH